MNQTKVIIADSDIEYSRALAKALAAKETKFNVVLDFDLRSCGHDSLSKSLMDEDTLLLVDKERKEHLTGTNVDSSKILGLLPVGREAKKRTGFINKYEGLSGIMEDLWMLSGHRTGREECLPRLSVSRFIAVTGGAGGTGKTSVAIALGRELRLLNDASTLYISFENACVTEQYFPPFGGDKSLNDLLYYLHTESLHHIADHMKAVLIEDAYGLETFQPSDNINELTNAQPELVRKLIEQVVRWKEYSYIILDFQLEATNRCHWLLSGCDCVIAVDDDTFAAARKTRLLLDHWQRRTDTDPDKSVLFVQNKWVEDKEELIVKDSKRHYIEFDPESFHRCNDRTEIEMGRRFGMGVKKIAATIRKGN